MQLLSLRCLLLSGSVAFPVGVAAEPVDIQRTQLMDHGLETPQSLSRVVAQKIEMAPGAAGSPHRHPMPVVGYLLAGSIAYQLEGRPVEVLHAGSTFEEPANALVVRWESVGDEPAIFVAHYLALSPEQPLIVREP